MQWLKHAFAIDPPGPVEPTDAQRQIVERVCREVVRRHSTTPALIALESSRPLNYIGAQALHFFTPILSAIADGTQVREFAQFLEQRGSVDYVCRELERLEANATRVEGRELSVEGADTVKRLEAHHTEQTVTECDALRSDQPFGNPQ